MASARLIVGSRSITVRDAHAVVHDYTHSAERTYAYPAYDGYSGSGGREVSGPDLLAPVLLNVSHLKLKAYYALLRHAEVINAHLTELRSVPSLDQATPDDYEPMVKLFALLDLPGRELPGVRLTVLSKILHRKRPDLIPLYDRNIRACYLDGDAPRIPPKNGRSWEAFVRLWIPEIQRDLASQLSHWQELAAVARAEVPITPLRALDIVGWHLGGSKS